jgi:hypothetical protein
VQGLLFPMMLLPCISVVSICNRSAERGWPSMEMGLVSLLAFIGGYAATGFATAAELFATMALANVLSILSGMRHLADHGDIRWSRAILPFPSDARFMLRPAVTAPATPRGRICALSIPSDPESPLRLSVLHVRLHPRSGAPSGWRSTCRGAAGGGLGQPNSVHRRRRGITYCRGPEGRSLRLRRN